MQPVPSRRHARKRPASLWTAPGSLNNQGIVARVLWRDAQGNEGSLELSGGEIQIGRGMDCAVRTDDAMVSRHHARLFWAGGQYYLEDLGSANGVFYQEQRVTRHLLKHGDAVRCGSLWLRFVAPELAQQAGTPQGQGPGVQAIADPASGGVQYPATAAPSQGSAQGSGPAGRDPTGQPVAAPITGGFAELLGGGGASSEEVARLKRRLEQLETELRLYRRGRGEEVAKRIDELEERHDAMRVERDKALQRVRELEGVLQTEGNDAKGQRARILLTRTGEIVQQLNDLLSNLRINVMAAEGEFEQFAHQLPRASFELIRESLRSSSHEVDLARDLLRELRDLAG